MRDVDADRLGAQLGHVVALGDDADLALVHRLEVVRHRRPADIDLAGHHLGIGAGNTAGRHQLRRDTEGRPEAEHHAVGRGALGREGDGLAVAILDRLDRAVGRHVPEEIGGAGSAVGDDAQRRALGIGAHGAERAAGDAEIGAARQHRLQRLAAALGVEDVDGDTVLRPDAGAHAHLADRGVPIALLADRQREFLGGARRADGGGKHRRQGGGEQGAAMHGHFLPMFWPVFRLLSCASAIFSPVMKSTTRMSSAYISGMSKSR